MDWFESPGYFRPYRHQVDQVSIFLGIKGEGGEMKGYDPATFWLAKAKG